jgi:hypothetical protein
MSASDINQRIDRALSINSAQPFAFSFNPLTTALIVIDMQCDFVRPGGFGASLGNDVTPLQSIVPKNCCQQRAMPDCRSSTLGSVISPI